MSIYTRLAKMAVENYIKEGKVITPPKDAPGELLNKKAGVFVTITKNGDLRGCIGTYLPTKDNIAKEIISNAILAATEDDRFGSVKIEELPNLSYTVYILDKPEPIKNIDELDPQKYGIIVQSGFKSGLLLPGLEDIDSREKQIFYACQKAGIDPQVDPISIYKFKAQKYE